MVDALRLGTLKLDVRSVWIAGVRSGARSGIGENQLPTAVRRLAKLRDPNGASYDPALPSRTGNVIVMSRLFHRAFATISLLIATAVVHAATDLSVAIISAPISGCALGSSEPVTLKLFNHGDALPSGARFDASFSVDGAESVLEPVTLAAPLPTDAALSYTFHRAADLSAAGPHRIDAAVKIAGDAKPGNNALIGHVAVNFAASQGGTVSGPESAYSGALVLAGATGTVRQWERSTHGGERWQVEESQANTWTFDKLTRATQFRAQVKNGSCAPAYSTTWTVVPN